MMIEIALGLCACLLVGVLFFPLGRRLHVREVQRRPARSTPKPLGRYAAFDYVRDVFKGLAAVVVLGVPIIVAGLVMYHIGAFLLSILTG